VIPDAARVLECMAQHFVTKFQIEQPGNARSTGSALGEAVVAAARRIAAPIADGAGYFVANSVWLLDDFTPENGATRFVAGSHRWRRLPEPDFYEAHPDEQLVLGKAGDVVVMNAHMWHGGTANRTAAPRRAMHVYYTRYDQPQQQYQKRWLSAAVQARLSPAARGILALDDALNDELSSTGGGKSGFMK
jgi:hypothetical protein